MTTLKDILDLNYGITLIDVYLRNPDHTLIKRVIIGEGYNLSIYEKSDAERGRLEYIDKSINVHGRTNKKGQSEMAYGVDYKQIPSELLTAEVTNITDLRERSGHIDGNRITATIVPIQMRLSEVEQ